MRKLLRSVIRRLGFDGMDRERFDRLAAAAAAGETQEKLRPLFYGWAQQSVRPLFLVQIGANDGSSHDHATALREQANIQSLLVEPNPRCHDALRAICTANPRVQFLPHALGSGDDTTQLYRFAADTEKGLQLDLFTSFSREHVEHFRRYYHLSTQITTQPVETRTISSLLKVSNFPRLDLLISDIEGYDHLAVEQALALPEPPKLIVFEHYWLESARRERCYQRLTEAGYGIFHGATDTFCART